MPPTQTIAGVCHQCGCTESTPCILGGLDLTSGQMVTMPCAWLDDDRDLCTNPDCIKKAYHAVCREIDQRSLMEETWTMNRLSD